MSLNMLIFIAGALVLSGVCASKLSSRFNIPILLVFLAVGMLAGSDGIGVLHFENAVSANEIGSIALAFILFSGGYDTRWSSVKPVIGYGSVLSSLGVLLTALLTGVFVWLAFGVDFKWGLLLGSIVSSTDAAAVFAIFRSKSVSLTGKLQPLLEYESGSNDPMAAFLTLFMIDWIVNPNLSPWMILPMFALRMGIGTAAGYLVAKAAAKLFNRIDLEYDGLYYVLSIGVVLLAFGGTELLFGNGFMAVYVCGLVLGNSKFIYQHGVGRFHEGTGWMMQVLLFVMLGLLSFPHKLPQIAGIGLGVSVFMMFAARPIATFLCLIGSRYRFRERLFIAWVGLRGGAPIVLATFPMMNAAVPHNDELFHIVFFIVLTSVLLQGKTLMPVARLLKLDKPLRQRPRIPISVENTGNTNSEMREYEVMPEAPFADKPLSEANLPKGALVLLIRRQENLVVPNGATPLVANDVLMVFGEPAILAELASTEGLRDAE